MVSEKNREAHQTGHEQRTDVNSHPKRLILKNYGESTFSNGFGIASSLTASRRRTRWPRAGSGTEIAQGKTQLAMKLFEISNRGLAVIGVLVLVLWGLILAERAVIEQAREVLIFGRMPDWAGLAIYTLAAATVAWAGYAWFQKTRKGFADVL